MRYNYTNLTDGNDFTSFLRFGNDVTQGFFGPLLLLVVFLVVFISMQPFYPGDRVFATASFVTAVFSLGLRWIGVVSDFWVFTVFLLVAVAGVVLYFSK